MSDDNDLAYSDSSASSSDINEEEEYDYDEEAFKAYVTDMLENRLISMESLAYVLQNIYFCHQ